MGTTYQIDEFFNIHYDFVPKTNDDCIILNKDEYTVE